MLSKKITLYGKDGILSEYIYRGHISNEVSYRKKEEKTGIKIRYLYTDDKIYFKMDNIIYECDVLSTGDGYFMIDHDELGIMALVEYDKRLLE